MLNTIGVFTYSFAQIDWIIITYICKATSVGARLEVIRDMLILVSGLGNSTLCLYNLTTLRALDLYDITARDIAIVTEYTSIVISEDSLFISLCNESTWHPVIAEYRISNNAITLVGYYNIMGYRLVGLTHNGLSKLYFI